MYGADPQVLTEDETLVLGACLQTMQDGKPVKLPRTVTVAGMTGNLVRFDQEKKDCVLEPAGAGSRTVLIGAAALVLATGGYFFYMRGRR